MIIIIVTIIIIINIIIIIKVINIRWSQWSQLIHLICITIIIYIYITINIRYHHQKKHPFHLFHTSDRPRYWIWSAGARKSALDTSSNSPALTERESTRPRPLEGNRTWEVMKPWRLEDIGMMLAICLGDPDVLFWKMGEVLYRTLIILPPD